MTTPSTGDVASSGGGSATAFAELPQQMSGTMAAMAGGVGFPRRSTMSAHAEPPSPDDLPGPEIDPAPAPVELPATPPIVTPVPPPPPPITD